MNTGTTTETKGDSAVLNNAPRAMDNASRKGDLNAPNKDQAEMNTAPAKPGDDTVGKMDKDVDVKLDNTTKADADVKTDADTKADADTKMSADTKTDADTKMGAGSDAMKDGAECPGTREQLRKRVEARITDLESELAKCDANATDERAQGLRTELQVAKDAVGGGWEHVGEMEALRLSKWLQATSTLVAQGNGDTDNGPEAMMGSNKPSDGSVMTTEKPGVTLNALGQEVPPTYPT